MRLRHHILSAALLALCAVASLAPAASADRDRDRDDRRGSRHGDSYRNDDRDWQDSRNRDRGYGWDRGDRRGERRSYYYEDPYCGQRSQYISDFKGHYSHADHAPLIVKIDIRSGAVLARYRYDDRAEEWRSWDRGSRRGGWNRYGGSYSSGSYSNGGYGGYDDRSCSRCEDD